MAIYHLSIKIITRGSGKSAVAAAAYRAGENLTSQYDGMVHDYTKKGGVVHSEILLPENAPAEYSDRSTLWNAVEAAERYKTAQLAREIEIALPMELTREQQISLTRKFVRDVFVLAGMCADFSIHDKKDGNPHAHIMLTTRPLKQDGAWGAKSRTVNGKKQNTVDWNDRERAEEWRGKWASFANDALREHGLLTEENTLDHRSYKRQGIELIPTIHLGVAAHQMEKRGIRTGRGEINRQARITNTELRQLKARISKLQNWIKEEMKNPAPPTLADVIQEILSRREQAGKSDRYQSIGNLKAAAKLLNFLTANGIKDMAGLAEKAREMRGKQMAVQNELKPIERRLKVLNKHIQHADTYMQFREVYRQYRQQKPGKRESFAAAHHMEIVRYEEADRYLKGVMNGKTALPFRAWKAEHAELTTKKDRLYQRYNSLKDEVREVEKIRKGVEGVLQQEQWQLRRTQNMER